MHTKKREKVIHQIVIIIDKICLLFTVITIYCGSYRWKQRWCMTQSVPSWMRWGSFTEQVQVLQGCE